MATGFSWIKITTAHTITFSKQYPSVVYDAVCDEISNLASKMGLACLSYLDGAGVCLFNYRQCQDILLYELPALRSHHLSDKAMRILSELEVAIQENESPYALLYFDGD